MKNLAISLFILTVMLMSCADEAKKNKLGKLYSLKDLKGEWVNIKYLKSVRATKSAMAAQGVCEYSFVRFHNDSALLVISFHEGVDFKVDSLSDNVFKGTNDFDSTLFKLKNDTLFLTFQNKIDTLVAYPITIASFTYANRLLNKEIFEGNYEVVGAGNKTISFTADGQVSGFLNFSKYFVSDDYFDAGCNYDMIYFNTNKNDRTNKFTWKFKADTLCIYQLDCAVFDTVSSYCTETKVGKLIYALKKK